MRCALDHWVAYDVAAFTRNGRGGNLAGVALLPDLQPFPTVAAMQAMAARAGYSEVVFARREGAYSLRARYFTPMQEVGMCGHATLALFRVCIAMGLGTRGMYRLFTNDREYSVSVDNDQGLLQPRIHFPDVHLVGVLSPRDVALCYEALGLPHQATPLLPPMAKVCAGLTDILCPVADRATLDAIRIDRAGVAALSASHDVVGIHAFACGSSPGEIYCRNFAPAVGIDEESATGTSNVALAYWLGQHLPAGLKTSTVRFHQGDAMGYPSTVEVMLVEGAHAECMPSLSGQCVVHEGIPEWLDINLLN